MINILSCRIGSYGAFSLHAYEHLGEIGVKHIERGLPASREEADMLEEMLGDMGLDVTSFQVQLDPLDDKRFPSQVDDAIAMATRFGTRVLFTSIKAPERGKDRDKVFDRLRGLGERLESHGLRACLETHPTLVTNGAVGKASMERIRHPAVCINFDTANMYYYNKGIDAVKELDLVLPHVGSVHLKDTNGKFKTWCFPALGDGIVDFPAIVQKLDAAGFRGPYTMEIEGIEGEKLDLDGTKARIAKSVEYMRSIATFE